LRFFRVPHRDILSVLRVVFLPRDAMHKRGLYSSVLLSVVFVYCVKTSNHIVNSVMMKDCLVYVCIAWNYDVYLLIGCGVTKYYLVLLKCLLLRNFFVFSTCSQTRGHQYKLFKKHNASRLRPALFSERIINTWYSLPENVVDFSSLPRFRRSIQKVDFSSFLRCS